MRHGRCQGCGNHVVIDVAPDGHSRQISDVDAVLCGPVDADPEETDDCGCPWPGLGTCPHHPAGPEAA